MTRPSEHNVASLARRMRYGLQAKALLAPTVLILLMTVAFVTIFLSSERQSATLTRTFESAMVKNVTVADVRTQTVNIHSEMYRIMSLLAAKVDVAQLGQIGKQVTDKIIQARTLLETLKKDIQLSSSETSQIDRIIDALQTYDLSSKDAINAASSGLQIASIFMVGVEQNFNKLQGELGKLDAMVSVVQYGDILEDTKGVQTFVIILLAIAAILGVVLTVITMRQVTRPITDITTSMQRLASGNTDVKVTPLDRDDEIGEMARALAIFKANAIERKQAEEALRKARDNLEQKVEERTRSLSNEVAERKQAEERIKASLEEKEVLLQEIHHRVKNNLQVISSMLSLQAGTEKNDQSVQALKESQRRVLVMSRIHENLYQSDDMATIDAKDYLNVIMEDTKASSGNDAQDISFHLDAEGIIFDVDHAVPCGQIISELLSNSLKHAFPDGQTGTIEVSLRRRDGGKIELCVADDGIGLAEGFDIERTETLGMKLLHALSLQLHGEVKVDGVRGTRVEITFPEVEQWQRNAS